MPKRTKEEQREYQVQWLKRRREEWLKENGPCVKCNSWENLEIDHVDPKTKLYSVSSLWSLSPTNPKRVNELAKCQVLCSPCHKEKSSDARERWVRCKSNLHELTEDNVYTYVENGKTKRVCLACKNDRRKEFYFLNGR